MMYRAVCQPDGARGGGPLSACQQIRIFHPAGAVEVLCVSVGVCVRACVVNVGKTCACIL